MTPDELERVLDTQKAKQGGSGGLYFVALLIVALVAILFYAQR